MSDDNPLTNGVTEATRDLDYEQARLAYTIIETLLANISATNDLVALMAQALDEDTKHALTNTPPWTAYLDSRRALHRAQADLEKFTEAMKRLLADDDTP